jgi:hypothetical protein
MLLLSGGKSTENFTANNSEASYSDANPRKASGEL